MANNEKKNIYSAFFNFESCYTKRKSVYSTKVQRKLKKHIRKIERLLAYEKDK